MAFLDIKNLCVDIRIDKVWVNICSNLNISINEGEVCGMIGSSGSGKSIIAKALTGMYGPNMRVHTDSFRFNDIELNNMPSLMRRKVIGENIAIILQEARSSLDPSLPIITQMKRALPRKAFDSPWYKSLFWRKKTVNNLLHRVGIKDVNKVIHSYPYELSEVLCQKIIIAMALGRKPKLLIADDPISSMTSISQLQILRLIASFNKNSKVTVLYMTNDLAPSLKFMDKIYMLYCGQIVETSTSKELVARPKHPYTESMLNAIPDYNKNLRHKCKLKVLEGDPPEFTNIPIGCRLGSRCPYADKECNVMPGITKYKHGSYRCHFPLNIKDEEIQGK